jgi:hypothetical protein
MSQRLDDAHKTSNIKGHENRTTGMVNAGNPLPGAWRFPYSWVDANTAQLIAVLRED